MKKFELFLLVSAITSTVLVTWTLGIYLPLYFAKQVVIQEDGFWIDNSANEEVLRPLLAEMGRQYGSLARSNGAAFFKTFGHKSRIEPHFTNGYYIGTSWAQFKNGKLVYYVYASSSKEAIQKGGWMDAVASQRHEIVMTKP